MKLVLTWLSLPFIIALSYALGWFVIRLFEMAYGYFMPDWKIVKIFWDVSFNSIPVAIALKVGYMAAPSAKKTVTIIAAALFVGLIISYMVYVSYRNTLFDSIILGTGIVGSIVGCFWGIDGEDD